MKITAMIFTVTAAILGLAEGAAIPTRDIVPRTLGKNQDILDNLSYFFGLQMAGAATGQSELVAACADISSVGHGDWVALGLGPSLITGPICDASRSKPNPQAELPSMNDAFTNIFIYQLIGALDTTALAQLCNNIRYSGLDNFRMLNAEKTAEEICKAGNNPQPPRPFVDQPSAANATAGSDVTQLISWTYGLMYVAGASTDSEASTLCTGMAARTPNFDLMWMDGDVARSAVCSVKSGFNAGQSIPHIADSMSLTFLVMLESINKYTGYLSWLCETLQYEKMDALGLNSGLVQQRICADSKLAGE